MYLNVKPDGLFYKYVFKFFRVLNRLGFLKPNTRIHFYEQDDYILILTPLSGSSSVREVLQNVSRHELLGIPKDCKMKKLYYMDRNFNSRLNSFYNKKVRNPTNLPKLILLATCNPLTHVTQPDEFLEWIENTPNGEVKDKHIFDNKEILLAFSNYSGVPIPLNIKKDTIAIEELIGKSLGKVVNSTQDVALFAAPIDLPRKVTENE